MASADLGGHWDRLYHRQPTQLSWYQAEPAMSLALLEALGVGRDQPTVDVGGGSSLLVDRLLDRRFDDVTVLDLSGVALSQAQGRLGDRAKMVHWLQQDVLAWRPQRRYSAWHDRAVFHFLVEAGQRDAYLATLHAALAPRAGVVMGTFAADGPEQCSGMPVARYSPDDLGAVFGEQFRVVEHRREEHRTPAGQLQPFTWLAMVYGG
jgi:hypothetical protein